MWCGGGCRRARVRRGIGRRVEYTSLRGQPSCCVESPLVLDDFLLDVLVLLLIGVGSLDQMIHALHVLGIALLATELMFLGELLHQSVDEGLLMTDDWLWL